MRAHRLSEIAELLHGRLDGDDVVVTSVTVDSRDTQPGALFVALEGERTDGHAHVERALAAGASAAVVRSDAGAARGPTLRVDDTGPVLLRLAEAERRDMANVLVVGVTGANGKTTTKDMTHAVLSTRLRTHASPASYNNEVGVPLTILGAPPGIEALVVEMGARRLGDHELLSRVVRPDVVVVTNVGVAHMAIFGSWAAIVRSSAEPVDALERGGVAVLNGDDPVVRGFRARTAARTVLFGTSTDADVRAGAVRLDDLGHASFELAVGDHRESITLAIPGEHMVSNALAAAAAGTAVGISPAECAAGLKAAPVSPWRMETFTSRDGLLVVNDAYNANPESVAAGLKAARWMARGRRLIAVLGHMAELGTVSLEEHERVGGLAARLGVTRLVAVGDGARPIAAAAVREGLGPEDVATVETPEGAADLVRSWGRAGDVVYLKGSRIAGLERTAEALR
jgi:UDP-N-acetylmuramoyl-tripeptide--D-alanyl-D-alanine ligase